MLQLISLVDAGRALGHTFGLVLPSMNDLARLFLNTNWAHLLDPHQFQPINFAHALHLGAQRYDTAVGQQAVVNAALDIAMRTMAIERHTLQGLEWALNEITDNVLVHADAPEGGLVQVSTFSEHGELAFVVTDAGRGILASMQEGFPQLRTDAEAVEEAVKAGVTRSAAVGQGNGLAGTLRVAAASGGSVAITSGRAQLRLHLSEDGTNFAESIHRRRASGSVPGTTVEVRLRTNSAFTLYDALGFDAGAQNEAAEVWDIIESGYTDEEHNALRVTLSEEPTGFGTRAAGEQLRTKCSNLLRADPGKRLILDWSGIPLVSSSYADEAIGKLFLELGPMTFMARVQNVYVEPIVRSLLDRAIQQRVAQTASSEMRT